MSVPGITTDTHGNRYAAVPVEARRLGVAAQPARGLARSRRSRHR